ncbi:MAG: heterodisulfide reductase [Gammaproteobacteria bacterium]|nr:MAG: heterodisulfide reductase [Gammaproteobacteria bacterium]
MNSEVKIGTFLCKGCGLGDRLDMDQLELIATREGKVTYVKQHDYLCGDEGVALIQNDIDSGECNKIIVAACSKRVKTQAFNFPEVSVARANLREGVIWSQPDTEEAAELTQEMAADYIRMASAEIKFIQLPSASGEQEVNKNILVVGAGITGLTAALEAANTGYKVVLVEKEATLGGMTAKLYNRIPTKSPYQQPEDTGIESMIEKVNSSDNITVYTNTTIAKTEGAPGRFNITLDNDGTPETVSIGAIVQASGFTLHDPSHLEQFSYTGSDNIMTQADLEQHFTANAGAQVKTKDGKEIKRVTFIQCVGQRSEEEGHLSYCSGYCCGTSVKQAINFKQQNPDIDTKVIYTHLRVSTGVGGEDFYRSGQDQGVVFLKGTVSNVDASGDKLTVSYKDIILEEDLSFESDLVILATGMVPNSGVDANLTEMEGEEEKSEEEGAEENDLSIPVKSILNLDYRQGTDLPHLINGKGFNDSHFICFPYETARTGIYTAGPVRRPMDIHQASEDATGAALKAIQVVENAGKGRAAHPRSGDLSFPKFQNEGCTQCGRCTIECPFGAIDIGEDKYPKFNESRCRRCGTCMGACPVRVISFENYSIDTVGQQIKNIDIPDEFDEKPRILCLACENDAYPALDMAAHNRITHSAYVRIIPVRCLGSVSASWVSDALNTGFDGIVLMGCKTGDDYQCHFIKGSTLAKERMSKVADTLETMSLEPVRVSTYEVAITDIQRAPQLINDMADTIEEIGLNPFKF